MSSTADLSASLEDYIEAIFNIAAESRVARVKDIASALGVAKPSVTGALKGLAARGLVNWDPYSLVTLTAEGEVAAERVVRRHNAMARFLVEILGVGEDAAQAKACELEHVMDPEILSRLNKFVEFVEACPLAGEKFKEGFRRFFEFTDASHSCVECGRAAVEEATRADENAR